MNIDKLEQFRLCVAPQRATDPLWEIRSTAERVRDYQSGVRTIEKLDIQPGEMTFRQEAEEDLKNLLRLYCLPHLPEQLNELRQWIVESGFQPLTEAPWVDLAEIAMRIQLARISKPKLDENGKQIRGDAKAESEDEPKRDCGRLLKFAMNYWARDSDKFRAAELVSDGPIDYEEFVQKMWPCLTDKSQLNRKFHSLLQKVNSEDRLETTLKRVTRNSVQETPKTFVNLPRKAIQ